LERSDHVEVRNRFAAVAAVVDHDPVAGLRHAQLLRHRRRGEQQVSEQRLVGRPGLTDTRQRVLRDHQHVHGGLRIHIVDGHAEFVLVGEFRGNLPVDDLLKNGFHGRAGSEGPRPRGPRPGGIRALR